MSNEVTSPIQVVVNYLVALYRKTLNEHDINFFGSGSFKAVVHSSGNCGLYLGYYFIDKGNTDMSFTILNMFVEFFCNQLVKFTQSQFFTVESLKAMLGSTHNIRETLVSVLLRISSEFAHRAAGVSDQQVSC